MRSYPYNVIVTKSRDVLDSLFFPSNRARVSLNKFLDDLSTEDRNKLLILSPGRGHGFIELDFNQGKPGAGVFTVLKMVETSEIADFFVLNDHPVTTLSQNRIAKKRALLADPTKDQENDPASKYYISFGVGDDIRTWSGPYVMHLANAELSLTKDSVREIELSFTANSESVRCFTNNYVNDGTYTPLESSFDAKNKKYGRIKIEAEHEFRVTSGKFCSEGWDFSVRKLLQKYLRELFPSVPLGNILILFDTDLDANSASDDPKNGKKSPIRLNNYDRKVVMDHSANLKKMGISITPTLREVKKFETSVKKPKKSKGSKNNPREEAEKEDQNRLVKDVKKEELTGAAKVNAIRENIRKKVAGSGVQVGGSRIFGAKVTAVSQVTGQWFWEERKSYEVHHGFATDDVFFLKTSENLPFFATSKSTIPFGFRQPTSGKVELPPEHQKLLENFWNFANHELAREFKDVAGLERAEGLTIYESYVQAIEGEGIYEDISSRNKRSLRKIYDELDETSFRMQQAMTGERGEFIIKNPDIIKVFKSPPPPEEEEAKTMAEKISVKRKLDVAIQANRIKNAVSNLKDLSKTLPSDTEIETKAGSTSDGLIRGSTKAPAIRSNTDYTQETDEPELETKKAKISMRKLWENKAFELASEPAFDPLYDFARGLRPHLDKTSSFSLFEETDTKILGLLKDAGLIVNRESPIVVFGSKEITRKLLSPSREEQVDVAKLGKTFSYSNKDISENWKRYGEDFKQEFYSLKRRTSSFGETIDFGPFSDKFRETLTDDEFVFMHNVKNANVLSVKYQNKKYLSILNSLTPESAVRTAAANAKFSQYLTNNDVLLDAVLEYVKDKGISKGVGRGKIQRQVAALLGQDAEFQTLVYDKAGGKEGGEEALSKINVVDFATVIEFFVLDDDLPAPGPRVNVDLGNRHRAYTDILEDLNRHTTQVDIKTLPFFNNGPMLGRSSFLFGLQNNIIGSVLSNKSNYSVFNGKYNITQVRHYMSNSDAFSEFKMVRKFPANTTEADMTGETQKIPPSVMSVIKTYNKRSDPDQLSNKQLLNKLIENNDLNPNIP